MIFNKGSRLSNVKFYIDETELEIVRMEIFSFSKGFRLYKLLIKCESLLLLTPTFLLLLNKPTISEAYKSTGLTVWFEINYTKSKVMIFNKGSRLSNVKFYIDETELEIVRHYKYLGIMLSLNGSFTIIELNHRHRGDNLYVSVLIIQVNMNDQNHQLTH
jgi:hypothetical protein